MYRNGYLGSPCPVCGRDLGEVEHPVFVEDGISSIPFCSNSCRSEYKSQSSSSKNSRSREKSAEIEDDKDWGPEGRYVKSMWKAMK